MYVFFILQTSSAQRIIDFFVSQVNSATFWNISLDALLAFSSSCH
jgi:hypothetical protein